MPPTAETELLPREKNTAQTGSSSSCAPSHTSERVAVSNGPAHREHVPRNNMEADEDDDDDFDRPNPSLLTRLRSTMKCQGLCPQFVLRGEFSRNLEYCWRVASVHNSYTCARAVCRHSYADCVSCPLLLVV
jgi:hypothetical protein